MTSLDLLAIVAHPDDAELTCGGTLIKAARMGRRTGILDLTAGEMGSRGSAELRAREATEANAILGVAVRETLGLPDSGITNTPDTRRLLAGALRRLQPRVVIAPAPAPYGRHPDHRVAAELIRDAVFVGDTLFMPDYGSARCDFPNGSAEQLYDSIQRLYAMPDATRLFMCHDYRPGGRPLAFQTTVGEQKRSNIQINARTTKAEYVAFRAERDASLAAPVLILPSLQVNIRAGHLPPAESDGVSYLKVPLNVIGRPL